VGAKHINSLAGIRSSRVKSCILFLVRSEVSRRWALGSKAACDTDNDDDEDEDEDEDEDDEDGSPDNNAS